MFVIWFESERILLALRQDPEVAHLAAVYLEWMSLGLPGISQPHPHLFESYRRLSLCLQLYLATIFPIPRYVVLPVNFPAAAARVRRIIYGSNCDNHHRCTD
jgi:hypothetical protein